MKLSEKQLEQVSGAIITSFVNLHFLEEAKASGLFRHQTKKHVNRVINDLIEIENNLNGKIEFDTSIKYKLESLGVLIISWKFIVFVSMFIDFIDCYQKS